MSSVQSLRELINQRLTAAAEEIFSEFEKTIVQYEEVIDRQRRLLDITWRPAGTVHTAELPHQHVHDENVPPEHPQMKKEQEDLCTSQEGDQFVLMQEADMLVQCKSKCEEISREKFQSNEEIDRQRRLLDIIWKPQVTLHRIDLPQQHLCKEGETLTDQQLCNQERNFSLEQEDPEPSQIKEEQEEHCSSLDQNDPEPPQIKEEQEEFCTSLGQEDLEPPQTKEEQLEPCTSQDQEDPEPPKIKEEQDELCFSQQEEEFILKQATDTFLLTSTDEDSDHSELEPNRNQLLPYSSPVAESPHQEGSKHVDSGSTRNAGLKPKKSHNRNNSHTNNVDYSSLSDSHCDTDTGRKSVKRDACGNTLKSKYQIEKHHQIHKGVKPYACNACGKSFSFSPQLKVHMMIHKDEREFSCKTCGKHFSTSSNLTVHMRTHTGQKPYSCETCGKSFSQRQNLAVHMRSHTGEKSYSCETCGKSFRTSSQLTVHVRIHTSEKPYSCETCGKSFSQRYNLTVHMRSHTGEKSFFCETCGKSFRTSSHLTRHMRTHAGQKL